MTLTADVAELRARVEALEAVPVLTTVPSGEPWWRQYAKAVRGAVVSAIPVAVAVLADGRLTLNEGGLIALALLGVGGTVAATTNAPSEVDAPA